MIRRLNELSKPVVTTAALLGGLALAAPDSRAQTENGEEDATQLGDMLVTASRTAEPAITIPANTSVITAEDIAQTTATTVPDVLQHLAGVEVSSWAGTGRNATVDIRGFGETASANTLVLVDGRRINAPDLSGVDWTIIPLERIERIEVVRGGGSVMYGDNAVGGVINIITKRGAPEHTVQTDTTVGSYQYFKQSLALSGPLGDDWYYSANTSYTDTDGYRDNGYFRNKTAGLRLGYDPESWFGFDLSAGIKDDRYGMPGPLPEDVDPTSTTTPLDFAETEDYYAQLTPRVRFNDGSELSLGLRFRNYDSYSHWGGAWASDYEYKRYDWGISPQYKFGFNLADMHHRVVLGIDYSASDLHEIKNTWAPEIDKHRHETGYYISDKISLIADHLFLDLGYRRARVKYDFSNGEHDVYNMDAANAGLTYRYAPGSKLFVSYDRAYRTVRVDELGGPFFNQTLPPQISDHYQLGIQHSFDGKLIAGATVFQIDTEDEIFYDPLKMTNSNYEETRRRGIELELTAYPHEKLEIFANYTWMQPELGGDAYDENEIPGVARHSGSAGLKLFPTEKLTIDTRARWVDDKVLISDWNNSIGEDWDDDYVVWDMLVSYNLAPFTFYAGVNNILDQEYAEYGALNWMGNASIYPSPERNFIAGVKITKSF